MKRIPITDTLRALEGGAFVRDLTTAMSDLVAHVVERGANGKLTIELTVKHRTAEQVEIQSAYSVKTPKETRATSLFFPDEHGDLHRSNPRQYKLEGIPDPDEPQAVEEPPGAESA